MKEISDELIERAFSKDRDALPQQPTLPDPNLLVREEVPSPLPSSSTLHGFALKTVIAIISVGSIGTSTYFLWPKAIPTRTPEPASVLDRGTATRPISAPSPARTSSIVSERGKDQRHAVAQAASNPPAERAQKASEAPDTQKLILPNGAPKTYSNSNASLKITNEDSVKK